MIVGVQRKDVISPFIQLVDTDYWINILKIRCNQDVFNEGFHFLQLPNLQKARGITISDLATYK